MEIAVLVSGVADPKWPLPRDLSLAALQAHAAKYAVPSPFDEAALELALKLRDAEGAVRITALVAGDEAFARRIAAWRPDALHRLGLAEVPAWDACAAAGALADAWRALVPGAAFGLIGREFGDFDDGSVPAALAERAGLPQVSLVLALERRDGALWALRQGGDGLERVRLPARALLPVTNDPGNRLRHPLMKNLMAAKKAPIGTWRADASRGQVTLDAVQPQAAPQRATACEWLQGSPAEKAQALARVLAAPGRG